MQSTNMADDFSCNFLRLIRKMKQQVEVFSYQQRFKRELHNKMIKEMLYLSYCEI